MVISRRKMSCEFDTQDNDPCTPYDMSWTSTWLEDYAAVLPGSRDCDALFCTSEAAEATFHTLFSVLMDVFDLLTRIQRGNKTRDRGVREGYGNLTL